MIGIGSIVVSVAKSGPKAAVESSQNPGIAKLFHAGYRSPKLTHHAGLENNLGSASLRAGFRTGACIGRGQSSRLAVITPARCSTVECAGGCRRQEFTQSHLFLLIVLPALCNDRSEETRSDDRILDFHALTPAAQH